VKIEVVNLTKSRIDKKYFQKIGGIVLAKLKKPENAELSLVFVGDAGMKKLNKEYRGINKTTDVLSFFYGEGKIHPNPPLQKGGVGLLGEIIISMPQAKRQAKEKSYPLKRELSELFVHGILHLVGYEDETEEGYQRIIKKQKEILEHLRF
jgi:probable rRNA maturation factor